MRFGIWFRVAGVKTRPSDQKSHKSLIVWSALQIPVTRGDWDLFPAFSSADLCYRTPNPSSGSATTKVTTVVETKSRPKSEVRLQPVARQTQSGKQVAKFVSYFSDSEFDRTCSFCQVSWLHESVTFDIRLHAYSTSSSITNSNRMLIHRRNRSLLTVLVHIYLYHA